MKTMRLYRFILRYFSGLLPALALCATSHAQVGQIPETQSADIVAEIVEGFMLTQAESLPGAARVTVDTPRITNQPACDALEPFLPGGKRLRSRMSVGVRCLAPQSWTTYVQVNLIVDGFYYVANKTLNPGDVVSLNDVVAREGDILRLTGGVVSDPGQIIGYIVTQRVPAGNPVKSTALRDPESIQRGQAVRTVARGPGFVATGEGQALQSGGPGAQIQVRSSSGQVITGVVLDANTVLIPM